jgi:membrane-bound lytic murein transglycosylase D
VTGRLSVRTTCALAAALAAGACASGSGGTLAAPAPAETTLEVHELAPFTSLVELELAEHEPVVVEIDEILATEAMNDPAFRDAVDRWVAYWQGAAAGAVPDFLGRMGSFGSMVDSALAEAGLPPSLRYLPFIESGYNPRAASRASAVGMWQFMAATAGGLGMQVTPLLDERRDPARSTEAAIAFLTSLHEEFGSWFMVLAAYNGGPNRMRRIVDRYAPGVEPSDSLFWALRAHFPPETRDFVPKLFGAAIVAADPGAHGHEAAVHEPFRYDLVSVPDATTLDVIARAAAVPHAEIERLNPQFVRGITPRGRVTSIRVPEGRGAAFTAAYALIPPDERVTFVEHRVANGETLSHIAIRYGVRVADIQAANPSVRPRALRIGTLLTVPVAPSVRGAQAGG